MQGAGGLVTNVAAALGDERAHLPAGFSARQGEQEVQGRSHMHFTWCTCTRVQMENLKLLSETLLDNYRITIDMKKECTRVLLGLASPLFAC